VGADEARVAGRATDVATILSVAEGKLDCATMSSLDAVDADTARVEEREIDGVMMFSDRLWGAGAERAAEGEIVCAAAASPPRRAYTA
jgi:hypothetical protein